MKIFLLTLFSAVAVVCAAESENSARKAIEKYDGFTITDGSSYFTFSKDGKFNSGPMGLSGRQLKGAWTLADNSEFTVIAKLEWANGLQPVDDYRRIVFRISSVQKRAVQSSISFGAPTELFDSYCLIEEFVKIPKPKDAKANR